jgi:hypothetical protein
MCNSDLILFFFLCKLKCIFEIFKITQKSQKLTTKNRISNQSGNDPLSNGQKSKFSKKKNRKKLSFGFFFVFFTNMHRKRREFHTRTTFISFRAAFFVNGNGQLPHFIFTTFLTILISF